MHDADILGFARTRRDDAVQVVLFGGGHGLHGFGDGAHLVGLDQHCIASAQGSTLGNARGVGDKKIIANDLQAFTQQRRHVAHALDIVFGKPIFHRDDGVVVDPAFIDLQELVPVEAAVFAAPVVNAFVVVLGGGQIQTNRHLLTGFEARLFNRFEQGFNRAFVGTKLRPKAAFISHAQVLAALVQVFARRVVDLGHPSQGLGKAASPMRQCQKILQVHAAFGVCAAAKNLNFRQGQGHVIIARQITPQGQVGLRTGGPQTRQRHGRGAVATQA